MRTAKLMLACVFAMAMTHFAELSAQVHTIVPNVVPGAKSVTVERI